MFPIASRIGDVLADALCPERCAACARIVATSVLFCHACRAGVNVLGPPECERCGQPRARAGRCDACRTDGTPTIRCARAWAAYDGAHSVRPVATALAQFKYGRVRRLGWRLAAAMATRVVDVAETTVVPVPLHVTRLRERGFNQSAVLARHLGRMLDRTVALRFLLRTRDTPSQTALSAPARAANVAGAFAVREPESVRDRAFLLVDDVWTSGATARAAASALCAAGARRVDVVTFARVL
jgi:ComF family protein